MKQIKYIITLLIVALTIANAFSQSERRFIRKGNKMFNKAIKDTTRVDTTQFSLAEDAYRKGLNKNPKDEKWQFNLADALYKQKQFQSAEEKFNELTESFIEKEGKAKAYHNLGNSQLMQKKVDESIESYKKALRLNPNDLNTKYNLAYAQLIKKRQQQNQNNQNQNNKNNKDDKNNKNDKNNKGNENDKKDSEKDDKNQNKNQQDKNKQNQDNKNNEQDKKDQQNQKQQQNKISQKDAEQLLKALQNDEKKIQKKVKKAKAVKAKSSRTEKEW